MARPDIMNVLLWSPGGAGLHYNGAGTNAYRLYRSAAMDGLRVTLVCAGDKQSSDTVFTDIVRLHDTNSARAWDQAAFLYKAHRWLRTNARRFDVFHGIDIFESTVRPAVWAQSLGLPAIVKPAAHGKGLVAGTSWRRVFRLPQRRRALLRRLSAVVAISSAIERELAGFGIGNVVRIPNGVDSVRFRPPAAGERARLRAQLGWAGDAFVVLFVGLVNPRKRPRWVLDALAPCFAAHPNMQAVFVGPQIGTYRDELQQRVVCEGWGRQVVFTGHRTEVEPYYRAADVFVLPSTVEGMPNALLEAMASGLPCLATRISGCEDLIDEGVNGFFVDSPEAIRQRVLEYMTHPALAAAHGAAARETVLAGYANHLVMAAYVRLFESVRRASAT